IPALPPLWAPCQRRLLIDSPIGAHQSSIVFVKSSVSRSSTSSDPHSGHTGTGLSGDQSHTKPQSKHAILIILHTSCVDRDTSVSSLHTIHYQKLRLTLDPGVFWL